MSLESKEFLLFSIPIVIILISAIIPLFVHKKKKFKEIFGRSPSILRIRDDNDVQKVVDLKLKELLHKVNKHKKTYDIYREARDTAYFFGY